MWTLREELRGQRLLCCPDGHSETDQMEVNRSQSFSLPQRRLFNKETLDTREQVNETQTDVSAAESSHTEALNVMWFHHDTLTTVISVKKRHATLSARSS